MKYKKIFWSVNLVLILLGIGFFCIYKYLVGEKVKANVSGTKTITTQAEWQAGALSNIDASGAPESIKINNKTLTQNQIDLWTIYEEDNSRVIATTDESNAYKVIDDDYGTYWSSLIQNSYWQIDLGEIFTISDFFWQGSCEYFYPYISLDGSNWSSSQFQFQGTPSCHFIYNPPALLRYVRIKRTGPPPLGEFVKELKLYESSATATHTTASTQIDGSESLVSWDTFTPTQTTPSDTKIEYQFRTSANGTDWSEWTDKQEYSGSPISLSSLSAQRYLQVQATLTTYDSDATPQINDYTIGYTYSTAGVCDNFDHLEVKLSSEGDSSYSQTRNSILPSSSAGSTVAVDGRAINTSDEIMDGISITYSSSDCVKTDGNTFTAPVQGGSCTISATSECGGSATISLSVAEEEDLCGNGICDPGEEGSCVADCGDIYCNWGQIESVEISPNPINLKPAQKAHLKAVFKDGSGNVVDPKDVSGFQLVRQFLGGFSYWDVQHGGGTLSNENTENFTVDFTAGSKKGTFKDTVIFSACGGELEAVATVIISSGGGGGDGGGGGGTYIYSYFEPPEITMVPGETRTFKVKVFDDAGNEVTDSSSYTFSLTRNDVGEIINHSGNTVTFRAGSEIGRFENLIKVNVKYGDLTDFSYATVGVIQNFDQNTDWFLKPSFYHLNMYLDEGIKVFFYPYAIIQKGQAAYSDKVKVNITLTDESAGTIVQTGNDWVIFKPAKEGCFPNLFKGEFDYYGQTHTAFAGVNVAPKDPLSSMAQYAPKIDFVTLQKFSVINKDKVTQFVPQIFDPLSRRIPLISPYFSFDGSGNPVWIPSIYRFTLNKSELGSISSQGFLDVKEGVQAGDYSQAINLSYSHRGEVYNNTWDLKVLADYPAWYISPLPDKLKLPPNTIFYLFHPQDEYQDAFSDYNFGYYEVDADPSALYQYQPFLAVFKTGNVAGTYEKAITLEGTYSSGGKREISLEIDPQMSLDACAGGIVIPPNLPTPPKKIDVWPKVVGTLASFFQKPFNNFWLTALALLLPIPALINLLNRLFAKYPHWLSQLGLPAVPQARIHGKILAYDYDSKKPLALAKLLVYSYPDRHLVSQTLSNNKGEFILSIPQGNYFLNVQKGGYKPLEIIRLDAKSTFVQGRSDGYYDDIYYPEEIVSIKPKEKQALSLSMPMVLEKKSKIKGLGKTLVGFLRKYSLVFLIIGTVLSLAAFLSSPHQLFNNIILFYYMVLWAFEVYFFVFVGTGIAKVVDKSGKPIPLVLARAFDLKNNLAEIAVSDQNGLLQFSLSPGQYIFKFKKPGFGMKVLPLEFKSLKQLGDMEIVMEEKKR